MKVCRVKNIEIGNGKPKVCLPIIGKDNNEILSMLDSFDDLEYDLIELRIDFYKDILDPFKVIELLKELRSKTERPLLLTYRSLKEGGEVQLTDEQYVDLVRTVCKSQLIDLVDIELMSGNSLVFQLVDIAHQNDIKVVMSNHDFEKTPSSYEMMERLEKMEILGADILKIAVMPVTYKDVITLLNTTLDMSHKLEKPIVTMSMGQLGKISRMVGELTGSAITFASAGQNSAPGQINVKDIQVILEAIHHD